jgi:hypothetical protein
MSTIMVDVRPSVNRRLNWPGVVVAPAIAGLKQNNFGTETPKAAEHGRSVLKSFAIPIVVPPSDIAQYIADIILDLRNMANAANQKALRDLLELSFYEASFLANRTETPCEKLEKPIKTVDALVA